MLKESSLTSSLLGDIIDAAVNPLNAYKLEEMEVNNALKPHTIFSTTTMSTESSPRDSFAIKPNGMSGETFRKAVIDTLVQNFFYKPSFEIHGGVTGLYDYGPPGCALKSNVLAVWHQHFVREEDMLVLECPSVTPGVVLKASGHVDKFTDPMVKDVKTGVCYRADTLIKDHCNRKLEKDLALSSEKANEFKHVLNVVGDLSLEQLGAKIKEYSIVAPYTGNSLSDPYLFSLMFATSIGPNAMKPGYMRPETAQGIFVNFKDLYKYNGNKLPFAAAQVGQVFRNEISPRHGLLRVREFTLAEIEHFMDPHIKSHPKYSMVSNLEFLMFPRDEQMTGQSAKRLRLGDAVSMGIVNNQTLAYFMGRAYLFLIRLGIDEKRLRFRQHLPNEMAHYATDCWDAEIECSYGWIECVGIADRAAYDLRAHSEKSGVALVAKEKYETPLLVERVIITPNKKELNLAFKHDQKMVVESLEAMNEIEALEMKATLEAKGEVEFQVCKLEKTFKIKKNMLSIAKERKLEYSRTFTPHVIESGFGIGRIIYCLCEHSFYTRLNEARDKQLNVFRFSPLVAPYKCYIFPIQKKKEIEEVVQHISDALKAAGIDHKKDITGASKMIKYKRADELGVPFAVAVDGSSATIRELVSKDIIRVKVEAVEEVVKKLSEGGTTWDDILQKYRGTSVEDQ